MSNYCEEFYKNLKEKSTKGPKYPPFENEDDQNKCECCKNHYVVLKDFWLDNDIMLKKGQIIGDPINPEWRPRLVRQIWPVQENSKEAAEYIANNSDNQNEIEQLISSNSGSSQSNQICENCNICYNGCSRCNNIIVEI